MMIVIILVQGAAISHFSSVQCAVLFQIITLAFWLSTALLLPQIFLDSPLCIGKLTGFLVCLIKLCVHCRQLLTERRDTLFQLLHGRDMSRRIKLQHLCTDFPIFGEFIAVVFLILLFITTAKSFQLLAVVLYLPIFFQNIQLDFQIFNLCFQVIQLGH